MSTYDALTDEQKADIARYHTYAAGVFSSLAKLFRESDAATWSQFAVDNVDPYLDPLADAEVIPNPTDLGGAKDLTAAELRQARQVLRDLKAMRENNNSLLVKLVGVNA